MLATHPTRYGGLVNSERFSGLSLSFKMVNQTVEKRIHGSPLYGNSPNHRYGYTPLQEYGLPPNNSEMELKDRLKQARKHRKMSQVQLSEATGLDQTTISNLETGKVLSTSKLVEIAYALRVDPRWLATGSGEMEGRFESGFSSDAKPNNSGSYGAELIQTQLSSFGGMGSLGGDVAQPPILGGMAPLISWVQAGAFTESVVFDLSEDTEYYPRPANASDATFVLRVVGESMIDEYRPGTLIFVDPERSAVSGDDVVARMEGTGEATFKRYIEEPGVGKMLKALNSAWADPYLKINGNCRIVGVVVADMRLR